MPQDLPKTVVRLINACWKSNPDERPTFEEVMRAMPTVMIDSAIPQPELAELWTSLCPANEVRTQVPFDEFSTAMIKKLRADEPFAPSLFRELFATKVDGEPVVDYEVVGKVVRFLPTFSLTNEWFQEVVNLVKQEWFWGQVSSTESQKKLVSGDKRRFIIRWSSQAPHYTISIRNTNTKDPVAHRRILRREDSPEVELERDMLSLKKGTYKSIQELVKLCEKKLKLKPLAGGPFEWIFLANPYSMEGSDAYATDLRIK